MQYYYTATPAATTALAKVYAMITYKRKLCAGYTTPQLQHKAKVLWAVCTVAATPVSLPALVAALAAIAPTSTVRVSPTLTAAKAHIWAMQKLGALQSRGLLAIANGSVTQAN